PTASAQNPQGVTIDPVAPMAAPIPYEGTAKLPLTVVVGCAEILSAMSANNGAAPLTFAVSAAPTWLTIGDASADLANPDSVTTCLEGTGSRTYAAELPLTVTKDAPGVVDHVIQVVATVGSTSSEPTPASFTVAYHVNYTLVADATFPLDVNGTEASFNVVVTQASNARSMVMIEDLKSSAGVLSGIGSQAYENDAGAPATKTFKVTFKAPTGAWTNATASFKAYGHYLLLDGRAGEYDAGTPMAFSFVNTATASDEEPADGKDSPAPVGALVALGLVGLAAFARRRA
ncbi:MAG: hypothetical protein WC876_08525, partial [Candidatus Thermoplasmatota archaeon]